MEIIWNQFTAGIVSGLILMLMGQWLTFRAWKKQQAWLLRRSVYIEAIELIVRVHDLTRQIRSSYLAADHEGVEALQRVRDPLFIDIDVCAVKAGFLLPQYNERVVDALVNVTGAQSKLGGEVTKRVDAAATLEEKVGIIAKGLESQAHIYSESLKELRECAHLDVGVRVAFLANLGRALAHTPLQSRDRHHAPWAGRIGNIRPC